MNIKHTFYIKNNTIINNITMKDEEYHILQNLPHSNYK